VDKESQRKCVVFRKDFTPSSIIEIAAVERRGAAETRPFRGVPALTMHGTQA
jgi:hypothetical protein